MTDQKQVLIRTTEEFHREVKHYCIDQSVSMNDLFVSSVQEKMNVKSDKKPIEKVNKKESDNDIFKAKATLEILEADVKYIRRKNSAVKRDSNISKLAESIHKNGLMQPLILVKDGVEECNQWYKSLSSDSIMQAVFQAYDREDKARCVVNALIFDDEKDEGIKEAKQQIALFKALK
jgi:hypothetical protein